MPGSIVEVDLEDGDLLTMEAEPDLGELQGSHVGNDWEISGDTWILEGDYGSCLKDIMLDLCCFLYTKTLKKWERLLKHIM